MHVVSLDHLLEKGKRQVLSSACYNIKEPGYEVHSLAVVKHASVDCSIRL
jgi:hypothetical protein